MDRHGGQNSRSNTYQEHIKNLVITGGNFSQDNRHHTTHYHDNSKTFHTRNENTVFEDKVYGFIGSANNAGTVTACTTQNEGSDDETIPRSLRAVDHNQVDRNLVQSPRQANWNRVAPKPSRPRDVLAGRSKTMGSLMLRGGGDYSPPAAHCRQLPPIEAGLEAEISQLSPDMQGYLANLENDYLQGVVPVKEVERNKAKTAPRKSATAQRRRQYALQRRGGPGHSFDETFTEQPYLDYRV